MEETAEIDEAPPWSGALSYSLRGSEEASASPFLCFTSSAVAAKSSL